MNRIRKLRLSNKLFIVIVTAAIISWGMFLIFRDNRNVVLNFFKENNILDKSTNTLIAEITDYLENVEVSGKEKLSKQDVKMIQKKLNSYHGIFANVYYLNIDVEDDENAEIVVEEYSEDMEININGDIISLEYDEGYDYMVGTEITRNYYDFFTTSPFYGVGSFYPEELVDTGIIKMGNAHYAITYFSAYSIPLMEAYMIFSIAVPIIVFVLCILLFIRYKMKYLSKIGEGIKMMESGDLSIPVIKKGSDELGELSDQLNRLRITLADNIESESIARQSNKDLITAMSHDLRTPLTSLMGYLDIISLKRYKNDEQLDHYLSASKEKAIQIKELSDRLFQYFIVYDIDHEILLETIHLSDMIALIDEHNEELKSRGFHFNVYKEIQDLEINGNLSVLKRIFDNVYSNIYKYGDKNKEVIISIYVDTGKLVISQLNRISTIVEKVESNGIGLRSSTKMMHQHSGELISRISQDIYEIQLCFPVLEKNEESKQTKQVNEVV